MKVTREMIGAAHDILLKKEMVLSADLLADIYMAMESRNSETESLRQQLANVQEHCRVAEREPKTRKVKMECFLIDGELHWRDENLSVLSHWIRQPHRDIVMEVPE